MHKYRAKPTVVDGIRFSSMAEAKRYQELRLLERAGEIEALETQPRFELSVDNAAYPERGGRSVRIGEYRGDFRYRDNLGVVFVEDVKGYDTPLSRWKRKHVEAQYGVTVRIIK